MKVPFIRIEILFVFEYKIMLYLPKDWGLAHLLELAWQARGDRFELIFTQNKTQVKRLFFVQIYFDQN
jgi:hypothetical protein